MPLNPKASVSENIRELHTGKTYAHTAEKFGKDRANRQAIAIAMHVAGKGRAEGGVAPKSSDPYWLDSWLRNQYETHGVPYPHPAPPASTLRQLPAPEPEESDDPRKPDRRDVYPTQFPGPLANGGVVPHYAEGGAPNTEFVEPPHETGLHDVHAGTPAFFPGDTSFPHFPLTKDDVKSENEIRRHLYNNPDAGYDSDVEKWRSMHRPDVPMYADGGPADVTPDPDWQTATEGLGQTLGRDLHDVWLGLKTAAQIGRERLKRDYQPSWYNPQPERASGGVVPRYDAGGTVNPVQAVITALNAGANTSGLGSASMGSTNPAAPSAPAAGATTAAPATATSNPAVPASTMQANPATATAPQAAPAMATTATPAPTAQQPAAPMQTKLMATGGAAERAMGGGFGLIKPPSMDPMYREREEARDMLHPKMSIGPVISADPGRADTHLMKVPSGSYILPAAHVAAMGQGNSMAGLKIAHQMFGAPPIRVGAGAPRPPHGTLATGGIAPSAVLPYSEGGARGNGEDNIPVDVHLSGSEYIIPPWMVRKVGHGDLKHGHRVLDAWVMHARKKEIKTLQKLPPPAKR